MSPAGAAGREYYGTVQTCAGAKRKTIGASERDHSQALPRGRPREFDPILPTRTQTLKEIEVAAGALGVKLQYLDVRSLKDIEAAFRAARKSRADAVLWLVSGPIGGINRPRIGELAVKSRLPAIYEQAEYVEAGGLMSYGVSFTDLDRRAATYVDKILKGAKPADLPVSNRRSLSSSSISKPPSRSA